MTMWVIEAREEIAVIAGVHVAWRLDPTAGAFTDYELVAEEVYRRNQAERRLLEEQLEQNYQERLAVWRTSAAEHRVLAEAGLRRGPAVGLAEPKRSRCIHTDTYRVSQALSVHSGA